jgi:cold-inducible RNA-binding protein
MRPPWPNSATCALYLHFKTGRFALFSHIRLLALSDRYYVPGSYDMAKKLYVGNLPHSATKEQLQELFAQAGEIVEVALITDRETGRLKGFGFVEMATDEGAQEAIRRLNGYNLDNRTLTVNEARPREERSGGGFGGGGRRDNRSRGGNRREGGYTGNRKRF